MLDNAGGASTLPLLLASLAAVLASAALIGPWVTAAVGSLFVRLWRGAPALLAGRRLFDDPKGAYRSSAGVVLAVFTGSMALTLLASAATLVGSSSPFETSALYTPAPSMQRAETIAAETDESLRRYGLADRALVVPNVWFTDGERRREGFVLDCADARRSLRVELGSCAGEAPGVHAPAGFDPVRDGVLAGGTSTGSGAGPDAERSGGGSTVPLDADTPVYELPEDEDVHQPVIVHPDALPDEVAYEAAYVVLTPGAGEREVQRTALARAAGTMGVHSIEALVADQHVRMDDLRRVTVIGLVAAAVLSGCSAAITTAGSVFDRRRTFGALLAAGTPVRVLSTALRTEAALPALVATIGAGTVGVAVGIGLFGIVSPKDPVLTPWIAAPVVLGLVAAVLAASVCGPALKRISTEPLTDE